MVSRLNNEYRVVFLDGRDRQQANLRDPNWNGESLGHWEGDTLVVETSRISYPYYNSGGAPMSENARVTERFELSEDQTQLVYHLSVVDSLALIEPSSYQRLFVALGEPFIVLDCTIF